MTDTPDTLMKQYFAVYTSLGGVSDFTKFVSLHDDFIKHTINSFVYGDVCEDNEDPFQDEEGNWVYHSNKESMEGFCQATHTSYEEASKIFEAVDTITAYS